AAECLPARILAGMREETERIWSSLDVQIVWIDSVDAGRGSATGLTVLIEESADPAWPANREPGLANLHRPSGACQGGIGHVWVRQIRRHAASVRREQSFAPAPSALNDALVERALGRALAHEIGHYLLGTGNHAPHGLMRPYFSPQELLVEAIQPLYGLSSHDRTLLSRRAEN